MHKILTPLSLAQERTYKRTRKLELSWYGFCSICASLSLALSSFRAGNHLFAEENKTHNLSHLIEQRGNFLSGLSLLSLFPAIIISSPIERTMDFLFSDSLSLPHTRACKRKHENNRNRAKADIRNFYSTNQNCTKSCKAVPASRTCDGTASKENITSWSWICWVHR